MRGSIQKREGKKGTSYRVRVDYVTEDGRREQWSRTFSTEKEAEREMAKLVTQIDAGVAVKPVGDTLSDLAHRWLDTVAKHRVQPTSLEDYRAILEKHVLPELGSVKVQKLTAHRVQRFYSDKLAAGASPRTVQLCHLRLSQVLSQGLKWGLVPRNVCEAVDPPRVTYKPGKTWTAEEARTFLAEAESDTYYPLWLVLLTTGLRRGEVLGLRWSDLDLPARTLRVAQSVVLLKGAPVIQRPKTKASERVVKLPAETAEALQSHRLRQVELRLSRGDVWEDHDLVFCTGLGKPLNPNNLYRNFNELVAKAGVPAIRLHDLRHTHATLLLVAGENVKVVQERLGHARSSITMDTYAHVLPGMQDGAADTVSALFFTAKRA